jgi:hypothetical protein
MHVLGYFVGPKTKRELAWDFVLLLICEIGTF